MKPSMLDKTFTLRQAARAFGSILAAVLLIYAVLLVRNAWDIKMGGIGLAHMQYKNFPERCQKIVDIHRGGVGGTPFEGLRDRTIKRDVASLINESDCWGYSIRAAIDSSPVDGGSRSQANVRIIFLKDDPIDSKKKRKVVTLRVEYHD